MSPTKACDNASSAVLVAALLAWNCENGSFADDATCANMLPDLGLDTKSSPMLIKKSLKLLLLGACLDLIKSIARLYLDSISSPPFWKSCLDASGLGISNPDVIPSPVDPPILNIGLLKVLLFIII